MDYNAYVASPIKWINAIILYLIEFVFTKVKFNFEN